MTPAERLALLHRMRDEMEEFIERLEGVVRECERIDTEARGV